MTKTGSCAKKHETINQPKIGKAIFKRVTSHFQGRNDYPRLRIAPRPVFDMHARDLLNQHFDLARSLALICKRKTVMDNGIVKARNILAGNF
ncbi:hypothetical protein AVEN_229848-1 [Araneus ventricosus]|uniref:Uncharacterized protein n=1 Tax=Araneus ventricosus TaxID=182803 RepID=A0A4Y2PSQ0_ARAVE|nr:hypothetical protein AVEN_229848-1 [Araneus ventricosus]